MSITMSLDFDIDCDKCRGDLSQDDSCYCSECYKDLEDRVIYLEGVLKEYKIPFDANNNESAAIKNCNHDWKLMPESIVPDGGQYCWKCNCRRFNPPKPAEKPKDVQV